MADVRYGEEKAERGSTTWLEVEAAVDDGGYRAGFVAVFAEFRGAVLDDEPLSADGRPKVVNASNFAKHFGIARSTFQHWLEEHGGPEFKLEGERKQKAEEAKARQKGKTAKKDQDAAAQEVRKTVASSAGEFRDKAAVHRSDSNHWFTDLQTLVEWDAPGQEKAAVVEDYVNLLDKEVAAAVKARDVLLAWLTEHDAGDGTAAA